MSLGQIVRLTTLNSSWTNCNGEIVLSGINNMWIYSPLWRCLWAKLKNLSAWVQISNIKNNKGIGVGSTSNLIVLQQGWWMGGRIAMGPTWGVGGPKVECIQCVEGSGSGTQVLVGRLLTVDVELEGIKPKHAEPSEREKTHCPTWGGPHINQSSRVVDTWTAASVAPFGRPGQTRWLENPKRHDPRCVLVYF